MLGQFPNNGLKNSEVTHMYQTFTYYGWNNEL